MPRPVLTGLASVLVLALAGGCGSSDKAADKPAAAHPPAAAADLSKFPAARGTTLGQLRQRFPEGPIFAPAVSLLEVGKNRVGFALFDRAHKQLADAPVAVYTSKPDGSGLAGPYAAHPESLAVKAQFQSRSTAADPDAATSIYVAEVPFRRTGKVVLSAVAQVGGKMVTTSRFGRPVVRSGGPPDVGEKATRISTPTAADVAGDLAKIDTRVPPASDLHATDFADVLGKKPAVLLFATPRLCQSRVCGPVVDVAEQVRSEVGDRVAFVHMEVFRDNDIDKGVRPQFAAYRLETEPWAFVVGADGRVKARFEGAFSARELSAAVAKVQ
jgi:hypothetical protein